MSEIIIGHSIPGYESFKVYSDLFDGLNHIESSTPSLLILNFDFDKIGDKTIGRIRSFLKKTDTPTIVITNQNSLNFFRDLEHIEVIRRDIFSECLDGSIRKLKRMNSIDKQFVSLSKQKRTPFFYILGSVLFLEPFIKIFILQWKTDFPLEKVFDIVFSIQDPLKAIEFWALFPLAGLALVFASGLSLFVFGSIQLISIYTILTYEEFTWPFVQATPHISHLLIIALNSLMLIYFLIPENRKPFVEKTQNMFRKYKRQSIKEYHPLYMDNNAVEVFIEDMSLGGVSFLSKKDLEGFHDLRIQFFDLEMKLKIKRVSLNDDGHFNYGCSFVKLGRIKRKRLNKFLYKEEEISLLKSTS